VSLDPKAKPPGRASSSPTSEPAQQQRGERPRTESPPFSPTLRSSPSARWASWAWSSWAGCSRWGCRWCCC